MHEINATNVAEYLRATGRAAADERIDACELAGGVSNMVIRVRVESSGGAVSEFAVREFVAKQSRPRLRVAQTWLCGVERNWRELDVLRACERLVDIDAHRGELTIGTPRVLWEDRANYLFAMSAAPTDSRTWKDLLLAGKADVRIARACGRWLARLHAGSWHDPALAEQLGDRTLFDALRLDPYYRTVAAMHGDLARAMEKLIESVGAHSTSLVHADFSPKNLLVHGDRGGRGANDAGLTMINFETGHYGDGAFDIGFFLTHLVLKAVYHAPRHEPFLALADEFWAAYRPAMTAAVGGEETAALEARGMKHLAACALARLDGKSPVDYLSDEPKRDGLRRWSRAMLGAGAVDWPGARAMLADVVGDALGLHFV